MAFPYPLLHPWAHGLTPCPGSRGEGYSKHRHAEAASVDPVSSGYSLSADLICSATSPVVLTGAGLFPPHVGVVILYVPGVTPHFLKSTPH